MHRIATPVTGERRLRSGSEAAECGDLGPSKVSERFALAASIRESDSLFMESETSIRRMRIVTTVSTVLAGAACFWGWSQYRLRLDAEMRVSAAQQARSETEPARHASAPAKQPDSDPARAGDSDFEKTILMRYHQNFARERADEAKMGAKAQMEFMASREMLERTSKRFRENLALRYGRWYAAMKLSPSQIQSFEEAMMEKFNTTADVLIAARMAGASDNEVADLQRRQLAEADARLRLSMGDALHRELLKYELAADSQPLVEVFAGKMFNLDAPLTIQQADELGRVISEHAKVLREDEWLRRQVFAGADLRSWSDVEWDVVFDRAAMFLAPIQLTTLRRLAADSEFRRHVEQQLREADRKGRKAGSAQGSRF